VAAPKLAATSSNLEITLIRAAESANSPVAKVTKAFTKYLSTPLVFYNFSPTLSITFLTLLT